MRQRQHPVAEQHKALVGDLPGEPFVACRDRECLAEFALAALRRPHAPKCLQLRGRVAKLLGDRAGTGEHRQHRRWIIRAVPEGAAKRDQKPHLQHRVRSGFRPEAFQRPFRALARTPPSRRAGTIMAPIRPSVRCRRPHRRPRTMPNPGPRAGRRSAAHRCRTTRRGTAPPGRLSAAVTSARHCTACRRATAVVSPLAASFCAA